MEPKQFLCECHADSFAVERFLRLSRPVNHKRNIQEVFKAFNNQFRDRLAVGVVDNDKRKPTDLKNFESIYDEGVISLSQKPDSRHFLIIINPAIEGFLIESANQADIDLADYRMGSLKEMKYFTKNANIKRNQTVLKLLNDLRRANPDPIRLLKEFVNEIPSR